MQSIWMGQAIEHMCVMMVDKLQRNGFNRTMGYLSRCACREDEDRRYIQVMGVFKENAHVLLFYK